MDGSAFCDLTGAVRVFLTLQELSDLLKLPAGDELEAASGAAPEYRPGIWIVISGDYLPKDHTPSPITTLSWDEYQRRTRRSLGLVEAPMSDRRVPRRPEPQGRVADDGYTPVRRPVTQQFGEDPPKDWPSFPGQNLIYTGTQQGDPGDEDIHTGGPR